MHAGWDHRTLGNHHIDHHRIEASGSLVKADPDLRGAGEIRIGSAKGRF